MRVSGFLVVFMHFCIIVFAGGGDDNPFGARSAGMGNASVMLSDFWSVSQNQAGLATLKNIGGGLYYENRFFVNELSLKAGGFVLPTKSGVFGLSLSQFGYSRYNESKVGLAYAKKLWDFLSAGIQFNYINTYIAESYGNKGTAVAEIGLRAVPKENLYIGAHIFNPTRARIADYRDERIPTVMRLGIGCNFSKKVLVTAETEKDLQNIPVFRSGVEYNFMDHVFFRAGISSNPRKASFGIGFEYAGFKADLAFASHPVLGYSPHFSVMWELSRKDQTKSQL